MKPLTQIVFSAMLTCFLWSCADVYCITKESYLGAFSDFVEDVKSYSGTPSDAQIAEWDQDFEQYAQHCYEKYKEDFTEEEEQQYWLLTMQYYGTKTKGDILSSIQKGKDALSKFITGEMENTLGEADNILQDVLEEVQEGGKLNDLFKQVKDNIEEIGQEVEKILKEDNKQK